MNTQSHSVLDLFSAAAGGWSLGMHRAGFETVAACEVEEWRRILYAENNPRVRIYEDVRSLTADRLVRDLGTLPSYVVGSPPCQDISSANTKGQGVDGARSGLFFEAIRIIGEVRPRAFALENSANLRTRGADRVLEALEALGYACWPFVVGVDDVGGNNERKRCWIIGFDLAQLTHAPRLGRLAWPGNFEGDVKAVDGRFDGHDDGHGNAGDASEDGRRSGLSGRRDRAASGAEQPPCGNALDAEGLGHEGGRSRRRRPDGNGAPPTSGGGPVAHPDQARHPIRESQPSDLGPTAGETAERDDPAGGGDGSGSGGAEPLRQVDLRQADIRVALQHRPDWSLDDLTRHIRLDDGLPAWVAGARIAVGGPRGTSAASLIVEAFGDSVCPQIPEAIGRAILRTERALAEIYRAAA